MTESKLAQPESQEPLLGKIPPQAIELEEAVIASMLIDNSCIDTVAQILTPKSFYRQPNEVIASVLFSLHKRVNPIDILIVANELKRTGHLSQIGGYPYLTQLSNKVASAANVEYHAHIVQQKFIAREVISLSLSNQSQAFDESTDIAEVIGSTQKSLDSLMETMAGSHTRTLVDIISDTLDELSMSKEQTFGIPTPLSELNHVTNGWQKSDLIVFAGRPSRGKTAFALDNIRSACEAQKRVAIFSLEMKDTQLMKRLIYGQNQNYDEAGGVISRWKLDIFEKGGIDIAYVIANSRLIKRAKGLDMIVIDYLGLMKLPKAENRAYQIGEATRSLKALAKELDVPIILLAQLNREIEKRTGHTHSLSDLRESGDIEQDADIVIFISRPIMDGVLEDRDGNSTELMTIIQVEKNRSGKAPVRIKARNNERVSRYSDWITYDGKPNDIQSFLDNSGDQPGHKPMVPF
jgi:replicative DNA helicase